MKKNIYVKFFIILGVCILLFSNNYKTFAGGIDDGGTDIDIHGGGGSGGSGGSGGGSGGSTPTNQPRTIEYTQDQIIAFSDAPRVKEVIADRYATQQKALNNGSYYDMGAGRIPYPSYEKAQKTTCKWTDEDKNGNPIVYIKSVITPALYAVIDNSQSYEYQSDSKILYYNWHLDGPLALFHRDNGQGDYVDNSRDWNGAEYETVRVPADKAAIGHYVGSAQAYMSWNVYKFISYHYTYYEDWSPYNDRKTVLDSGNWSSPAEKISSGEGLQGDVKKTPFDVILQDLGIVKKIETTTIINDAKVTTELIK